MFDTMIRRITGAIWRKPEPPNVAAYPTFKAGRTDLQPQAGTLPENRQASSGILLSNHASGANDGKVEMSAPGNSVARIDDPHVAIDDAEFAAQPNSRTDQTDDRPGSIGMYDYRHPDHPVNRTHQPDRLAQLQRGAQARAVARNTRSRRSR